VTLATWEEISLDSLRAAQKLLDDGHFRSSVSRSYYAAYCAVTGELCRRNDRFARGRNNPAHEQLTALIRNGLPWQAGPRRRLTRAVRRLRFARETADYRPGVSVDRALALACVFDALAVLELLEISV
jgi:uncharacterized protein (UPF0332 family)